MDDTERVGNLVRQMFAETPTEPFKPFAMYNERLDHILVLLSDSSVTEHRVNEVLTLLEDNYPPAGGKAYAGFMIESARGFCAAHGLPTHGIVRLGAILDAIAKHHPDAAPVVNDIARPLLEDSGLEIVTWSTT